MPMRLDANQVGDIVEVDRLGRRFHALVAGHASGGLSLQPLGRRISTGVAEPVMNRGTGAELGKARATDEPLEFSPLQSNWTRRSAEQLHVDQRPRDANAVQC